MRSTIGDLEALPAIENLCTFFQHCDGERMILRLDRFKSELNLTIRLGHAFINAVAKTKFNGEEFLTFPFVRIACLAANLLSRVVEDGISKGLSIGDINGIATSSKRAVIKVIEADLQNISLWLDQMESHGCIAPNAADNILHRTMIRMVLLERKKAVVRSRRGRGSPWTRFGQRRPSIYWRP